MTTANPDEAADAAGAARPSPNADYSAAAVDRRLIVVPSAAVVVVGVIATAISAIVSGGKGLLAGAFGTIVVLAFFGISQFVVARVLQNNPMLAMNVALLTYVIQIVVLFGLLMVLQDATFFAPKAFALTIVACAITWTTSAALVLMKSKVLYVEPGSGPGQRD